MLKCGNLRFKVLLGLEKLDTGFTFWFSLTDSWLIDYSLHVWQLGRKVKKRETVVPDPDYRIPIVLLGGLLPIVCVILYLQCPSPTTLIHDPF